MPTTDDYMLAMKSASFDHDNLRVRVLRKMHASILGGSMDNGLNLKREATTTGAASSARPRTTGSELTVKSGKRSKSLSPLIRRRNRAPDQSSTTPTTTVDQQKMAAAESMVFRVHTPISGSSTPATIRNESQHHQAADIGGGNPDITITNAAGRLNGRTSGSGSGSETSPDSDQQGVVVTFRRSTNGHDGKSGSEAHSRSGSSENISISMADRKSSTGKRSSPPPNSDTQAAPSTSPGSPRSSKRERKHNSGEKLNVSIGSAASAATTPTSSISLSHSQLPQPPHAGANEKTRLQTAATQLKNFLAPNYKSRAEEFKKLFKPPENDRFVIDYSCAYQREILVHGRMYMSQNLLCFYSIIFKWETILVIRFKDITSITKEKTAKFIPNAIQVCTKTGEKFFFASFSMRDKAYMMMFKIWQNALLDQPMNPAELWGWAQHGYDEADFSGSEQEAEDALATLVDENASAGSQDFQNLRRLAASVPIAVPPGAGFVIGDTTLGSEDDSIRSRTAVDEAGSSLLQPKPMLRVGSGASSPGTAATTPAEEFTESDIETEINCPCTSHAGKEILNCVFPMSVDQLFLLLFTDSVFFRKLHEDRKTTDLMLSDWHVDKPAGTKTRQISYIVALNHSVGPKSCAVTETQICTAASKPGQMYVLKCDVCNMGVPYCDTFSVGVQYCLSRVSANQCRIRVHAAVVYKKSCWGIVKSFIEKNALNGIQDYFSDLNTHLHAECARFGLTDATGEPEAETRSSSRLKHRTAKAHRASEDEAPESPTRKAPATGTMQSLLPSEIENLAKGILLVLILMLLLNAALFYKLWHFESEAERGSFETTWREFETVLKKSDLSTNEWLHVFHQVRFAQKKQLAKWLYELDSAIKQVSDAESSLIAMRKQITMMQQNFGADNVFRDVVSESMKVKVKESESNAKVEH